MNNRNDWNYQNSGQWQQQPRKAVTRVRLGFGETLFHLIMTVLTCGLWLPVWLMRSAAGRKQTTRFK